MARWNAGDAVRCNGLIRRAKRREAPASRTRLGWWVMRVGAILWLLLLATGEDAAAGEDRTDVSKGHELVRAWCASCHAVERDQLIGPYMNVPNFTEIARLPSSTAIALHAFL